MKCGAANTLLRNFAAVTCVTLQRCWLVKEDGITIDEFCERVTFITLYVRVAALQR
jgi:hypothetical protein